MRWTWLAILLLLQILPARAGDPVIERVTAEAVLPAYRQLADAANRFEKDMAGLCEKPAADALTTARGGFDRLADAWSRVELIRFGPATEENRLERFLFWPDRKGIGLRQVQAALAAKDQSVAAPRELASKSVAMQGLGAAEFLLFGTGSEALASCEQYRCAYGQAIAGNLSAMAGELVSGWTDPGGIRRLWSEPGPENPLYRDEDEALTELLNLFVHGLEMVRDVRLNGFLGSSPKGDKPRQAIYRRSEGTVRSLANNIAALEDLFSKTDLSARLSPQDRWILDSIRFEFANARRALADLGGPIEEIIEDDRKRAKLDYFRLVTSSLSELFGTRLSGALGLSAGFSSLDGD